MKKFLVLFVLIFSLVSTETMAQSLLNRVNRAVDGYRQRSQQRTIQRNNSQQTYQNRQRYEQQERANQQRKAEMEARQRQQAEEQATRRKWIDAAKSVGLGFVNNLPKTVENIKKVMSW